MSKPCDPIPCPSFEAAALVSRCLYCTADSNIAELEIDDTDGFAILCCVDREACRGRRFDRYGDSEFVESFIAGSPWGRSP